MRTDDATQAPLTVAQGTTAHLWVCSGQSMGRRFELDRPQIRLGRSAMAEIPVVDANASQDHARVTRRQDGHYLEDRGSTNGTFVNHRRLTGTHKLVDRDLIQVGETVFEYVSGPRDIFQAPTAMQPQPSMLVDLRRPPAPFAPLPAQPLGMTYGQWVEDDEPDEPNGILQLLVGVWRFLVFFAPQWKLIVTCGLLAAIAGGLYVALRPPQRTSSFELTLFPLRSRPADDLPQREVPFFQGSERAFASPAAVSATSKAMGLALSPDRVEAIADRLTVARPDPRRPNTLMGTYADEDGDFAVAFLAHHVQRLLDLEKAEVLAATAMTRKLLKTSLARTDGEIASIQRDLRALDDKYKGIDAASEARLAKLRQDKADVEARIARQRTLLASLTKKMRSIPKLSKDGVDPYRPMIADKERELAQALSSGMGEQHPLVLRLRGEIRRLSTLSKDAGKVNNPRYIRLVLRRDEVELDLEVGRRDLATVERGIERLEPKAALRVDRTAEERELKLRLQSAEDKRKAIYSDLGKAERQLAAEEALASSRYRLVGPELLPDQRRQRLLQHGALGGAAGLLAGLLLAAFLRLRRDPTYTQALRSSSGTPPR